LQLVRDKSTKAMLIQRAIPDEQIADGRQQSDVAVSIFKEHELFVCIVGGADVGDRSAAHNTAKVIAPLGMRHAQRGEQALAK